LPFGSSAGSRTALTAARDALFVFSNRRKLHGLYEESVAHATMPVLPS
jgi:hypothetical protein